MEECSETLAFVSEPVMASLANVFAAEEQKQAAALAAQAQMTSASMNHHNNHNHHLPHQMAPQVNSRNIFAKEYDMLDIEIKYGLLQITEALTFVHNTMQLIHRNVCPSNIVITKRGTWKLFGFELVGTLYFFFITRPLIHQNIGLLQQ